MWSVDYPAKFRYLVQIQITDLALKMPKILTLKSPAAWWRPALFLVCTVFMSSVQPEKELRCSPSNACVLDLAGEFGCCATAGQKSFRGLHWETGWPDSRLAGARHLRRILWLEGLPDTYRYCTAPPHATCVMMCVSMGGWEEEGGGGKSPTATTNWPWWCQKWTPAAWERDAPVLSLSSLWFPCVTFLWWLTVNTAELTLLVSWHLGWVVGVHPWLSARGTVDPGETLMRLCGLP